MNRILEMLKLQQQLNYETNGVNWENGVTKNGKVIDWRRCIYLEAGELIESYPWKHWKDINGTPDYENIKIELVDIWHFIMSEALRVYRIENLGSIDDIAYMIVNLPQFNKFNSNDKIDNLDIYQEMKVVEDMVGVLFCKKSINELIGSFLITSSTLNLRLSELYRLYIGKNILNRFRQDNGYKDGTYIKIWNGKEDNVVMQNILDKNSNIRADELYNRLKELYPKG